MYADPKELERMAQRDQDERRRAANDFDEAIRKAAGRLSVVSQPSLTHSSERVRAVYIAPAESHDGTTQVDLVIGIDGANHAAVFVQGEPVARAVQRLRDLAAELERGAISRMENQR